MRRRGPRAWRTPKARPLLVTTDGANPLETQRLSVYEKDEDRARWSSTGELPYMPREMHPASFTTDGQSRLFICDTNNRCVQAFNLTGDYHGVALREGRQGIGEPALASWCSALDALIVLHKKEERWYLSRVEPGDPEELTQEFYAENCEPPKSKYNIEDLLNEISTDDDDDDDDITATTTATTTADSDTDTSDTDTDSGNVDTASVLLRIIEEGDEEEEVGVEGVKAQINDINISMNADSGVEDSDAENDVTPEAPSDYVRSHVSRLHRVQSARGVNSRTSPNRTSPGRTSPIMTSPSVTSPGRTPPSVTSPSRTPPSLSPFSRTSSGRTSPGRTSPNTTSPSRTPPSWSPFSRTSPSRTPTNRTTRRRSSSQSEAPGVDVGCSGGATSTKRPVARATERVEYEYVEDNQDINESGILMEDIGPEESEC